MARNLLALAQRLDELSSLLLLDGTDSGTGPPGFLEDGEGLTSTKRLQKLVGGWVYIVELLLPRIPANHPFLKAQGPKMKKIKETLLIDLRSALKEAKSKGDQVKCLDVLALFGDLDAEADAVKALKELKR